MPLANDLVPVIDTHRHYIGAKLRAKCVEQGLWDDKRPLPQAGGGDIVFYRDFVDLDYSIEQQRAGGVTKALASNGGEVEWVQQLYGCTPGDAVKILADERLEIRDAHPGDVGIMVDAHALAEDCLPDITRMVDGEGAKAISIASSYGQGKEQTFLDSGRAEWLWEYASAKGLVVHIHPPMLAIGADHLMLYRMNESTGRPFDTTITAARMINAGVFDRYPDLQVLFVHMGAGLMAILGRLEFNWRLNYHGVPQPPADKVIKAGRHPSDYMRTNVLVDTMGFSEIGVRAAIAMCGIDRVVFGTDYGPVPISPREHIDIVDAVSTSREDREKLLWRNADRIFRLGIAAGATSSVPASRVEA